MLPKALHYLLHQVCAQSRYGIHSPFVYDFVTRVLPHRSHPELLPIEALRKSLASSTQPIQIQDLGAGYGGKQLPTMTKTLAQIIKSSARGRREGALLYRMCRHYQPHTLLELGTNLGFSTLYQATALPQNHLLTIEGAPALAGIAQQHFQQFGFQHIESRVGDFDQVLSQIEWTTFKPAWALLDGNHQYQPTLDYFHFLLPRLQDGALIIFDDIYWSPGMAKAWKQICSHPQVSVSLDLWHLGICAIRKPQAKEHFSLRFLP